MKAYLNGLKAVAAKVGLALFQLSQTLNKLNLKARLVVFIVLTALMMPILFIGGGQRVSAKPIAAAAPIAAPVSAAPPEAFVVSSANTVSATVLSSVISVNAAVASGCFSSRVFYRTATARRICGRESGFTIFILYFLNSFIGFIFRLIPRSCYAIFQSC